MVICAKRHSVRWRRTPKPAQCLGWSLSELLAVLAIVGILATLALPSYTQQQRQARRSDAQTALLQLQLEQARYRGTQGTFAGSLSQLGWPSETSPQGHYRLHIAQADERGYTLEAHALGGQEADAACNPMRLVWRDAATVVRSSGADPHGDAARCWP